MMKAASLLIWLLGVTVASSKALNIDEGGFNQDGTVTYCGGQQGAATGAMPLPVDLAPSSAGKCPVGIEISPAQKDKIPVNQAVEVNWKAVGVDVKDSMFPQAYDIVGRRPQPVVAALMKACKEGTNCASAVDGQYVGNTPLTMTGAFGEDRTKSFPAFRFTFPESANYVFVAKVTLPGDASRNVSASEFVAFLRVAVGDSQLKLPSASPTSTPASSPTPTGTPSSASNSTSSSNKTTTKSHEDSVGSSGSGELPAGAPDMLIKNKGIKASSPSKSNDDPVSKQGDSQQHTPAGGSGSKAEQANAKAGNESALSKKNVLLLGAIGAGFCVVLIASVILVRKKRMQQAYREEAYKNNEADYLENSRGNSSDRRHNSRDRDDRSYSLQSSLQSSGTYDYDSCSDSEDSRDGASLRAANGVRLLAPIDEKNLRTQQQEERNAAQSVPQPRSTAAESSLMSFGYSETSSDQVSDWHDGEDMSNIDESSETMSNFDQPSETMSNFDDCHLSEFEREDSYASHVYGHDSESSRSTRSNRIFTGTSEVSVDSSIFRKSPRHDRDSYDSRLSEDYQPSNAGFSTASSGGSYGTNASKERSDSQLSFFSDSESFVLRG